MLPNARTTDPITSKLAGESVIDSSSTQRDIFLLAYKRVSNSEHRGAMTSEDAFYCAQLVAKAYNFVVSPRSYWKRVSELARMGYIEEVGKQQGSSGRLMTTYRITDAGLAACKVKGLK